MAPSRLWPSALVALVACSAPAAPPPAPPAPTDGDLLAHVWVVDDHVLAKTTALTDEDAAQYHGRELAITESSYQTPFHGTCDDAGRARREVILVEVAMDLNLSPAARKRAVRFGLNQGELLEYKLTCGTDARVPPLTLYVAGARAMTCFAGACYLLAH